MNEKKSIAVVDDHALIRKGVSALINYFPMHYVKYEAANGADLIKQVANGEMPDIVLLDIVMPEMDGYATASWIRKNHPKVKILALSTMDSELAIVKMIRSGAHGYILKDAEQEELKLAFEQVVSLGYYYNDVVSRKIVQSVNKLVDEENDLGLLVKLSDRESQFLQLACSEKTYAEIAKEMFVSDRTVDGYRDALFKKLNVVSRVGLVLYAIKNGIVKL
jgi:DNA-binding NarL/FixJ family response regulator